MNMNTFRDREARGYTLIEILVVVILIGILAAVGIGAYLRTIENNRRSQVEQTAEAMVRNARSIASSQVNAGYPANLPYAVENFLDAAAGAQNDQALWVTPNTTLEGTVTPDGTGGDGVLGEIDQPGYLVRVNASNSVAAAPTDVPQAYEVWRDADGNGTCNAGEYVALIAFARGTAAATQGAHIEIFDGTDVQATDAAGDGTNAIEVTDVDMDADPTTDPDVVTLGCNA